ncbi:MAG: 3-dehydroquinate synthase [Phycisphaerales bacterium]|nr:MAG: 3-dehydroquinate synthase [Phycisphaerales bacterium]
MMQTIDVNLPHDTYAIHIARGLLDRLGEITREATPHDRAMLVMDSNVAEPHGVIAARALESAGYAVVTRELVALESRKTLSTVQGMYEAMLAAKLDRTGPVIALGGGVVGDIAGFAAATYLRGVPVIQAPTTLLAMVDASVGGKTGVNFPLPADDAGRSELGKNLIGAFWQPRAVAIDPQVLVTLDQRGFRCGLAETVKHGVLADVSLLDFIAEHAAAIAALDMDVLEELIVRSVRIKAAIVEEDERETGRRALLNLGHTFAHVLEPIEALDLRHGEAVSIGMCAAAHCAVETNRMTSEEAGRLRGLLRRLGLPTGLPREVDAEALIDTMGYDKKVAGGKLRLILPRGLGAAEIVDDLDRSTLEAAWAAVEPGTSGGGG